MAESKELWDNNTKENPLIPEWFLSDWALGHASVDEDKDPLGNPVKKRDYIDVSKACNLLHIVKACNLLH